MRSQARDPGSPKVRTPTRYKPASSSEAVGLIGVGHERSSSTPLSAFADNAATEDDERLSPTCVSLSPPPFDEVRRRVRRRRVGASWAAEALCARWETPWPHERCADRYRAGEPPAGGGVLALAV